MVKSLTMTVDEVARMLRISRNNAYESVRRGEIPSIRFGKRILIPTAAFDKMLDCVETAARPVAAAE